MRFYYIVLLASTVLFILSACETQDLAQFEQGHYSCYLEDAKTEHRLCIEVRAESVEAKEASELCGALGGESTKIEYEFGGCENSAAVSGKCHASSGDITSSLLFYYPQYDEASAEEYCEGLGSPYQWSADGSVNLTQEVFAKEDIEEELTLKDLINDKIVKFP